MKSIKELKADARAQLKGKWGSAVGIIFLYGVIIALINLLTFIPIIGTIAIFLLTAPLALGLVLFSLRFKRGEEYSAGTLFDGFKQFGSTIGLYLWMTLWVFLWMLLLIIPGIIKAISYSMCFYILADNPDVGIRNALNLSKELMHGFKWKFVVLQLSFIGWVILSIVSLGIGFLWLVPYAQISMANFYDDLKANAADRNIFVDSTILN
ncbi:MAG: DUF975 family protein [Clostridiaceae bacterium]